MRINSEGTSFSRASNQESLVNKINNLGERNNQREEIAPENRFYDAQRYRPQQFEQRPLPNHREKYYDPRPNNKFGGGEIRHEHRYDYKNHRPQNEYYPYRRPDERILHKHSKNQNSIAKSDVVNYSASKSPMRRYFKFEDDKNQDEMKHNDQIEDQKINKEDEDEKYDYERYTFNRNMYSDRQYPSNRDLQKDIEKHGFGDEVKKQIEIGSEDIEKSELDDNQEECKILAEKMYIYAELQLAEESSLQELYKQKNFNIFSAFEMLNPNLGIVTVDSLHEALQNKLGIEITDKTIVEDIIQRLAFTSENQLHLLVSDMKFFEPERGTHYFDIYKTNISQSQVKIELI